jgi:predicted nucleic acid-binding protein
MTNDMKYLLDSNIISDFHDEFSSGHPKISGKLTSLTDTDRIYISILTLYELEYGWANALDDEEGGDQTENSRSPGRLRSFAALC